MKRIIKFTLVFISPIITITSPTPTLSSEAKLYMCTQWKKVSYGRTYPDDPQNQEDEPFLLKIFSKDQNQIEFAVGFRPRPSKVRPKRIIANRVVQQKHHSAYPQADIYLEDKPNYPGVFQLSSGYMFEEGVVEIREIVSTEYDYYAYCSRTN
jgi:hypothetical protein